MNASTLIGLDCAHMYPRVHSYKIAARAVTAYRLTGQVRTLQVNTSPVYFESDIGTYELMCTNLAGIAAVKLMDSNVYPLNFQDFMVAQDLASHINNTSIECVLRSGEDLVNGILKEDWYAIQVLAGYLSEYDIVETSDFLKIVQ